MLHSLLACEQPQPLRLNRTRTIHSHIVRLGGLPQRIQSLRKRTLKSMARLFSVHILLFSRTQRIRSGPDYEQALSHPLPIYTYLLIQT